MIQILKNYLYTLKKQTRNNNKNKKEKAIFKAMKKSFVKKVP